MTRVVFMPFDAEAYGCGAHLAWYDHVATWGVHGTYSVEDAEAWWRANVGVGEGYRSYGMPHPSTQAEVAEAYVAYIALARDLMRDRRAEEYAEPEYVGRPASRWETVEE